jgi:hypothetical protein
MTQLSRSQIRRIAIELDLVPTVRLMPCERYRTVDDVVCGTCGYFADEHEPDPHG